MAADSLFDTLRQCDVSVMSKLQVAVWADYADCRGMLGIALYLWISDMQKIIIIILTLDITCFHAGFQGSNRSLFFPVYVSIVTTCMNG